MKWPIYYKNLIKIGNPRSPVGIVTLWTICDKITAKISKNIYQAAGQLYTKNGINYLVKNLLANKKIRYLIIAGQDRSDSGQELKNIWQGKESKILHKEIKSSSLNNLTKSVKLIDLTGLEDGKKIEAEIKKLDLNIKSYGEPEIFPEPEEKDLNELECSWPTDTSIFKIRGQTVAQTWLKALKVILKFGDIKTTDAMKIKEALNLAAVITNENPNNFFLPKWLGLTPKKINDYLPQIIDGQKIKNLHYTYGERLQKHFKINQVEEIIKKLKKDKNARETVGILFDPSLDHVAEHRPCIVLIQALFNQGKLNFNAYVRSHDIFGGWPLNAFALRKLQSQICAKTKLPLGDLIIMSASAHIYDFNWKQALKISKENLRPRFENDSRGYFKIDIDKKKIEIIVRHFSPDGNFLKKYSAKIKNNPKAVTNLTKQIDEDLAVSLTIHSAYLGIELQKAATALELGLDYVQDRPLNY